MYLNNLLLLHIAKLSKDPETFENLKEAFPDFKTFAENSLIEDDFYESIVETIVVIQEDGFTRTETLIAGKLWSIKDQPAFVRSDGDKMWYRRGKCHRENDLPAIVGGADGYKS